MLTKLFDVSLTVACHRPGRASAIHFGKQVDMNPLSAKNPDLSRRAEMPKEKTPVKNVSGKNQGSGESRGFSHVKLTKPLSKEK